MARAKSEDASDALRAFGLTFPGAHLKSPWPGHKDLAVKDKTFAHLSLAKEPLSISVKLPVSGKAALLLPFAEPTGYGLGKSGWVSAKFDEGSSPPLGLLKEWVVESYRAVAPKRLLAEWEAQQGSAPSAPTPKAKAKKPAPRPRSARAVRKR